MKKKSFFNDSKQKMWYYIAVKNSSLLLRGIASKQHGDVYSLNRLILSQEKIKLNFMKKYVKIKIFVRL